MVISAKRKMKKQSDDGSGGGDVLQESDPDSDDSISWEEFIGKIIFFFLVFNFYNNVQSVKYTVNYFLFFFFIFKFFFITF